MKNKFIFLFCLTSLLASTGCAVSDGRPSSCLQKEGCQKRLKSAKHWSAVADNVAEHVAITSLSLKRSVFVTSRDNSDFARAFTSLLRSSLAQKGAQVSASAKDSLQLQFSVLSVKPISVSNGIFAKQSPFEVVITVSIADGDNYIFHDTLPYYVDHSDGNIFESFGPSRLIPVSGSLK